MTFLQNSSINRKSFRHRKVDNKKPLRIYTPGEINEDDCIPVSRAGIEIETGVEKEEEEEWHLVHALKVRTESMEKGATASGKATIPVPTSSRRISYYADVYQTHKWKKPSTYVKFSLPVEECIGCLYCMDEKDDIWLAEHKQKNHSTLTEDQFEEIMQHFENVAKNKPQLLAKKQIPTWQDCDAILPESLHGLRSEAETVHAHWRAKRWERMKQYQKAGPLMFEIKTQEGKDEEDHPWTCFRRRELKPIRRTRRTETASFDKLRKIRKDIHSGRHIMVNVTVREKTKKQKIELDRKIFEKECSVRELRKKLGIRNETSHEQPKRRKSSFAMDLLGATKTKSGIKLSKKDDEYPMTDITDFPYLIQRKPTAASFFRKFDSLKPTDRNSISCTAFRSRFGRGGRRRRVIDRLDVFSYKRIRETNERYKYDSDGIEDVFSDDEINQLDDDDDDDDDKVEDFTENMIRFHLFKEEDYQNLGVYRRIQKEKQNSPTKQQSLDALTGNHIPAQNPQHTPLANTESRQNIEQRDSRFARSNNTESRTTSQLDTRANQDSRQKLDLDPRTSTDPRRTNISNVDPRTFIDPRAFNGVNRSQNANTESSTNRDPRLSSNPPSTPRISNDPRTPGRLVVNNLNISDPRAHNGLILRPQVAVNHRENTPYRRPMPRNARLAEDSNNNTIGGVTNVVATPNGIASSLISAGSNNTSMPAASSLAKNHATTSAAQINSPARTSSSNGNTNGQGNGDGLTRTSSNPGIITNGTGQIVDPSKVFMTSSGHAKILMNGSGQMIDPSKIMVNSTGIINSEAQKISNMVKQQQQALNTSIQSTSATTQQMITPEQFSQITQLTDPESQRIMQQILSLYKTSNSVSTSNAAQLNNQRQSVVQTPRQNITVPSVGSNVPNSAISLLPTGMVQSPSTSVMRQNNAVQSSGSSSLAKPVIAQNFALPNGFNISPTSGSSNTINVNPNVSIGVNGSQQSFVHPSGIVNMSGIIQTNGQSPMRTANINGRSYLLPGNIQLNGANIRPNGSAHLANMVLPVNTAAINNVAQASNLANLNRHQLVNGAANPNLRQVSTNGAAIPNLRQLPNGAYINTNVFANNGNFGTNLTQMRPQTMMRIPNTLLGGNQILTNGTSMYDLILPSQSPRQNNVSPASVSTSNGGNNSVGTPSPQPQTERTVR